MTMEEVKLITITFNGDYIKLNCNWTVFQHLYTGHIPIPFQNTG